MIRRSERVLGSRTIKSNKDDPIVLKMMRRYMLDSIFSVLTMKRYIMCCRGIWTIIISYSYILRRMKAVALQTLKIMNRVTTNLYSLRDDDYDLSGLNGTQIVLYEENKAFNPT